MSGDTQLCSTECYLLDKLTLSCDHEHLLLLSVSQHKGIASSINDTLSIWLLNVPYS